MARSRSGSRGRILESASSLLRRYGYQGVRLAQIVEHSGAPRGSTYFLFPDGKEEIATEALQLSTATFADMIRDTRHHSNTPREWIGRMRASLADALESSGFTEGCPVSTVALDSTPQSARLTAAVREAYTSWLNALRDGLASYGLDEPDELAVVILSAFEGALLLCRSFATVQPLAAVEQHVVTTVEARLDAKGMGPPYSGSVN